MVIFLNCALVIGCIMIGFSTSLKDQPKLEKLCLRWGLGIALWAIGLFLSIIVTTLQTIF